LRVEDFNLETERMFIKTVTFHKTNQHHIPKDFDLETNEIKYGLIFICCSLLLCRLEDYGNPRTALFVTLIRTFLMEMVVIGVVAAFWLTFKKNSEVSSLSISLTNCMKPSLS
jgi:hypothetical protein